jgi:hypothetical protein
MKRPELEKAIEALGSGDVLVLAEWDRATRSMLDGIRIIERVAARGATFKALDRQWLDLTPALQTTVLLHFAHRSVPDLRSCRFAMTTRVVAYIPSWAAGEGIGSSEAVNPTTFERRT